MTPEERIRLKRKNFRSQVIKYFQFLIEEFGFETPMQESNTREDGTVISDTISYLNPVSSSKVTLHNGYNTSDYRFQLLIRDGFTGIRQRLYSVFREDQDIQQNYLEEVATLLINHLAKIETDPA
ncbi:MAG: hypothetical protein KJP00_00655 [Bacteroidia bacterium]|nr:hypothetical protein [Bacteroidia bacterium]